MRIAVLAICVLLPTIILADEWTPPENPDPNAILQEANADRRAGRYEIALAKHIWFHENALALQPAQSGVRLSFALMSWLELGELYPPALKELKQVRDETEKRVRDEDQVRIQFGDFHDLVALNKTLREEKRTAEVFQWIDDFDKDDAKRLFHVAEAALIKQKAYELCGKYIDPERDLRNIGRNYNMGLKLADERFGQPHREFTEKMFLNRATTLVALLVHNDRAAEAEDAAKTVKTFAQGEDLQKKLNVQLESALAGKVPDPWP